MSGLSADNSENDNLMDTNIAYEFKGVMTKRTVCQYDIETEMY